MLPQNGVHGPYQWRATNTIGVPRVPFKTYVFEKCASYSNGDHVSDGV
jgi:hypothetical protein